jgi:hypothetical protein
MECTVSTVDVACKVAVADMTLASSFMQLSQEAVVVERDGGPTHEAKDAGSPAQVDHDQARVAQDEGIVERGHNEETHREPVICQIPQKQQQNSQFKTQKSLELTCKSTTKVTVSMKGYDTCSNIPCKASGFCN